MTDETMELGRDLRRGGRAVTDEPVVFVEFRDEQAVEDRPVVFIESPFSGATVEEVRRNEDYARAAMLDSLNRGEIPIVTHLLWTQVWDDTDVEVREAALVLCRAMRRRCDAAVFYVDLGHSSGMARGMREAFEDGIPCDTRSIDGEGVSGD